MLNIEAYRAYYAAFWTVADVYSTDNVSQVVTEFKGNKYHDFLIVQALNLMAVKGHAGGACGRSHYTELYVRWVVLIKVRVARRQRYFNVSSLHELFDRVNAQNILGFITDIGLYRLL